MQHRAWRKNLGIDFWTSHGFVQALATIQKALAFIQKNGYYSIKKQSRIPFCAGVPTLVLEFIQSPSALRLPSPKGVCGKPYTHGHFWAWYSWNFENLYLEWLWEDDEEGCNVARPTFLQKGLCTPVQPTSRRRELGCRITATARVFPQTFQFFLFWVRDFRKFRNWSATCALLSFSSRPVTLL